LGIFVQKNKVPAQRKVFFYKPRARTGFMLHQNYIGSGKIIWYATFTNYNWTLLWGASLVN